MCTIRPPPLSIIESSTARVIVIVPRRLTSMIRFQVSSVLSTKRPMTSTAALLTRTSTGPSSTVTRSTAACTAALSEMSAPTPVARTPYRSTVEARDLGGGLRVQVADGDRGSLGGEPVGDRLADPASRSGDECHLVPYAHAPSLAQVPIQRYRITTSAK